MVGVWKHIYRLDIRDAVFGAQDFKIACLGCGIAADIHYALRLCSQNHLCHIRMNAGARRVENDDIRPAVSLDEIGCEYILHISRKELAIVNSVGCRVCLCIFYGFGNIFDSDDFRGPAGNELGNGARACVEVIYHL